MVANGHMGNGLTEEHIYIQGMKKNFSKSIYIVVYINNSLHSLRFVSDNLG